ncbi:hypothetical protein POM88_005043 [Heracleum sosnowskyi]|uniref:Uncharacterized protein n=1 Tax=Heracleum sosnowskyi TaxID=360622 RepID=A0AAD8NEZ0_9APIA|nr:hypothetical protein POM88_005043 [Heracleum sosnowskyi]
MSSITMMTVVPKRNGRTTLEIIPSLHGSRRPLRLAGSGSYGMQRECNLFVLFWDAPSMASLAWISISGSYDNSSKMLFFLSLFLFMSLVCRPKLFKKSMRRFNVAWWAYSFPITVLALSSTEYAQEVKSSIAHLLMVILSAISVLVTLVLMVFTAINTDLSSDSKFTSKPSADLILTASSSSTE